jgi:hypothetical protein
MNMTLEATPDALAPNTAPDPLAPAPVAKPETYLEFEIDDYDKPIELDMANIPQPVRMKLLRSATKSYIINRISTAVNKTNKTNQPFASYEAAMKNDPLQQIVPKPEGERATTDYAGIVNGAIKALYSGELGRRGTGEGSKKVLRDPLITQITRSVVAEVYEKERAKLPSYKYPTAQKEVGQDGLAYLRSKINAQLAATPEAERPAKAAALEKYLETRYIKPARIMLGLDTPKTLVDADSIL